MEGRGGWAGSVQFMVCSYWSMKASSWSLHLPANRLRSSSLVADSRTVCKWIRDGSLAHVQCDDSGQI